MCEERAAGVTTVKLEKMAIPTGGGNNMAAFDGDAFDDGACIPCPSLPMAPPSNSFWTVSRCRSRFPILEGQLQFGSFARANDDTADTTWDNLQIKPSPNRAMLSSPMTFPVTPLIRIGLLSTHLSLKEALAISCRGRGWSHALCGDHHPAMVVGWYLQWFYLCSFRIGNHYPVH